MRWSVFVCLTLCLQCAALLAPRPLSRTVELTSPSHIAGNCTRRVGRGQGDIDVMMRSMLRCTVRREVAMGQAAKPRPMGEVGAAKGEATQSQVQGVQPPIQSRGQCDGSIALNKPTLSSI
jgi:hypothetical protein